MLTYAHTHPLAVTAHHRTAQVLLGQSFHGPTDHGRLSVEDLLAEVQETGLMLVLAPGVLAQQQIGPLLRVPAQHKHVRPLTHPHKHPPPHFLMRSFSDSGVKSWDMGLAAPLLQYTQRESPALAT